MTEARRHKTPAMLDREVELFNTAYPVGAVVVYQSSPVTLRQWCRVSHPAFVLSGHTAVVQLDKVRSVVACDACSAPAVPPTESGHA